MPSPKRVDIAFVTVSFNTLDLIKELLEFFCSVNLPFSYRLVVVDNDSCDGSQEFLQQRNDINYIQSGSNCGYGRAINLGIAASDSGYVCVLNSDVLLNREALVTVWEFMEAHPAAGVAAPRITYRDGRDQGFIYRFSLLAHYSPLAAKLLSKWVKRQVARRREPFRVDGVMGAFFVIRRNVFGNTLFDEEFFFYCEDTALAHRLMNEHVACYAIPSASIVHYGGESSSTSCAAHFYTSKYLYLRKFYGDSHARLINIIDLLRFQWKRVMYGTFSRLSGSRHLMAKKEFYDVAIKAVLANLGRRPCAP